MGLTLGSLFDGIGGWLIAAKKNGIIPIWSSEIDEFAIKVSKAHFPDVEQLGNITKLNGGEIPPVDIICAGSPCQDLSVAGRRKGLNGERSNLFYEAVRITREMKERTNGNYPTYFVWENVTGAFSSNHGRDFQSVLSAITQGDIPMPKSGRWAKAGMVRSEGVGIAWRTLDAQYWGVPQHRERVFLIADFRGGVPSRYYLSWKACEGMLKRAAKHHRQIPEQLQNVLEKQSKNPVKIGGRIIDATFVGAGQLNQIYMKPLAGTLTCGHVAQWVLTTEKKGRSMKRMDKTDGTTNEKSHRRSPEGWEQEGGGVPMVIDENRVRRLTPLECERLQGLPDNYTAYGSDTARYRAIGNGMAHPCAVFVLEKVLEMAKMDEKALLSIDRQRPIQKVRGGRK